MSAGAGGFGPVGSALLAFLVAGYILLKSLLSGTLNWLVAGFFVAFGIAIVVGLT